MEKLNKSGADYLFLTEILNDLNRNGFVDGGKAHTMLNDWKHELRYQSNFPKTKQKKIHAELCGAVNWNPGH